MSWSVPGEFIHSNILPSKAHLPTKPNPPGFLVHRNNPHCPRLDHSVRHDHGRCKMPDPACRLPQQPMPIV